MSDTSDGSSRAAQRAQWPETKKEPGFLARFFGKTATNGENGVLQSNGIHDSINGKIGSISNDIGNLKLVRVEEVAVPKAEIISVPLKIKLPDLVKVFRESGLTRLPVYQNTLDQPLGFVHLKDLALKYGFNGNGTSLNLRPLMRPLLFAPPSMPIGVLLQKMQTERVHLALVIDEYGGVDGLVSIEDLIEQVVGEIEDEHDIDDDNSWSIEKPGVYNAQSRTPLDEFEAEIGMNLSPGGDDDEVETLGGLVFLLTGRVPVRGEVIKHPLGLEFEIIEADARRIKRLRVCLPNAIST